MAEKETKGTVLSVKKQTWLKINTKPVRKNALDGAIFPHIIKLSYVVDGKEYIKRKWLDAGVRCPQEGENITVFYREENPSKFRLQGV